MFGGPREAARVSRGVMLVAVLIVTAFGPVFAADPVPAGAERVTVQIGAARRPAASA
jgi:hypothetical protein